MLQKNPLSPPLPYQPAAAVGRPSTVNERGRPFVSPEDFDATGVLAGMDPSESRYWWMPELQGAAMPAAAEPTTFGVHDPGRRTRGQATNRPASRTTAAA